jgi:hypothetical protein
MPKQLVATAWKKKARFQDLATGIPFAGCIFAGIYLSETFFLVALGAFAVGFILQRLRFRRCICETCGAQLRRRMKDDSPINFFCSNCDTIWTTDLWQDSPPA